MAKNDGGMMYVSGTRENTFTFTDFEIYSSESTESSGGLMYVNN